MKVLVTGGAGCIGSHTGGRSVGARLRRPHLGRLLARVRNDAGLPSHVPQADIEIVKGDVRNRAAWERAPGGADAVSHLAAYQGYLPDFSTFFHTSQAAPLSRIAAVRRMVGAQIILQTSR